MMCWELWKPKGIEIVHLFAALKLAGGQHEPADIYRKRGNALPGW